MNFVIYHSALRPFLELPDKAWAEFEQTGRIQWATDLAEIPQKAAGAFCVFFLILYPFHYSPRDALR
jgi:hypothetical protein